MKMTNDIEGLLVLADGQVFTGKLASPDIVTTGEICFNTGMTGYREVYRPIVLRPDISCHTCSYW